MHFQPKVPLIGGPRDVAAKPSESGQHLGHTFKIVIGGKDNTLKKQKQNKTTQKLEEQKGTKKDQAKPQGVPNKTPVAVGHHKVPPVDKPR